MSLLTRILSVQRCVEPSGDRGAERGFSLAEALVAIAILALTAGLIITMIFTAAEGTKVKLANVSAQTLSRSQMELIRDGTYQADPTAVPYPMVAPIAGYTVDIGVEYWTAPSGPFTATLRNDGLQRITVTVSDANGQLQQLLAYIVNR